MLVSYIFKEEDKYDELSLREKELEFVEEYSENELSDNKPDKQLCSKYSFNMIQFNVGIKWKFNSEDVVY